MNECYILSQFFISFRIIFKRNYESYTYSYFTFSFSLLQLWNHKLKIKNLWLFYFAQFMFDLIFLFRYHKNLEFIKNYQLFFIKIF